MAKTTFTLAEAALLLSCHAETLRRAIKNGTLYAARLGREYRISRTDLQAFWTERGGAELFGSEELPVSVAETSLTRVPPQNIPKNIPTQLKLLD